MPSSASVETSGARHPALSLAVVPLAALIVSLAAAFVSTLPPPWSAIHGGAKTRPGVQADTTNRQAPIVVPTAEPAAEPPVAPDIREPALGETTSLWTLLTRWALAVDALALLGIVALLAVRFGARPRRRART